jgi:hypothetical protein
MAITNIKLTRAAAANVVYAQTNQTRVITTIYLCNTGANVATANVYLVPASGNIISDANGNLIFTNLSIAAGDTYIVDSERIVLDTGDSIFANISSGTPGAVVMTVSSVGA